MTGGSAIFEKKSLKNFADCEGAPQFFENVFFVDPHPDVWLVVKSDSSDDESSHLVDLSLFSLDHSLYCISPSSVPRLFTSRFTVSQWRKIEKTVWKCLQLD